jgi:hypothetical protein
MELNKLSTATAHSAGAECNILSPVDGSPTDVFITIRGADSKEWRSLKKKQTTKILEAKAAGKMDDLDYDKMDVDALVDATISWRGLTKDGQEYPFTQENAVELYSSSPSVVNQLLEFLTDRANFTDG